MATSATRVLRRLARHRKPKQIHAIAGQPHRKRPSLLAYDVDEVPPLPVRISLSLQHVLAMSVGWIYVVVAITGIGGSPQEAESLIRMSMIASGVATILQARKGFWGSGYLCPASCSLTYLAPSMLAGQVGGLPLVYGMVTASGVFTAVLSRCIRRIRWLFPPDVTGLIVAIVGIQLVALGVPRFLGFIHVGVAAPPHSAWVGIITLCAMVVPTIWGTKSLRLYPIFFGLFAGFVSSLILGVRTWEQLRQTMSAPLLGIPHRAASGMSFSFPLIIPFLIIAIAASLKAVGDLTLCEKVNDADWKRTDLKSVSGGVLANSVGTIFSGLLGGFAQNTASASVGLSLATATTSRVLAYPAGILVIALAFVPKLAALFAAMPVPVMGAILVYSACFLVLGGFQVMTSRMLDSRRILAVGIAMVFGLSVEIAPDLYRDVPQLLHPMFASSTAVSTILVVLLNIIFRIGVKKRRTLELTPGEGSLEKINEFMEHQGSVWGMRREVIGRATDAVYEFVANAEAFRVRTSRFVVQGVFDEFSLDIDIKYEGPPVDLPDQMPAVEDLASGRGIAALSGYMIHQHADRVRVKQRSNHSILQLHFEH
jgi:xanthine permease XanP